jgi:hypothetical protein
MVGLPSRSAQSSGEPAGDGGAEEAARYIAATVSDLGHIARRHRLDTLSFLLDMAQMEADEIVRLREGRNPV